MSAIYYPLVTATSWLIRVKEYLKEKVKYSKNAKVLRLYSEIDHLHLSIEAQCVSHLLPPGDCHNNHVWGKKALPLKREPFSKTALQESPQPERLSFNMESQIGHFFCSETALL